MHPPEFDQARIYAATRLKEELSALLTYHSAWHTCDEVVSIAGRLAKMEGVNDFDEMLIQTAAYFHDIGFVQQRRNHEAISIDIARQVLPAFDYTSQHIEIIAGMIQATVIPQRPLNLLEQILADADLDVLGRTDFWVRDQNLRDEITSFDGPLGEHEWFCRQLRFLQQHRYFTHSAQILREAQKQQTIQLLTQRCLMGNGLS